MEDSVKNAHNKATSIDWIILAIFTISFIAVVFGTPIAAEIKSNTFNSYPSLILQLGVTPILLFCAGYSFLWFLMLFPSSTISLGMAAKKTIFAFCICILLLQFITGALLLLSFCGIYTPRIYPSATIWYALQNAHVMVFSGTAVYCCKSKT